MKRSDLKELIKQSMLEVAPKKDSGAMTPEEEKMVAGYEEEEANKYALDKEEPMEEAMVTPDNRVEFLANALGHVWNMGTGKNKIDLHSMAQSLVDDMFDQEAGLEENMSKADKVLNRPAHAISFEQMGMIMMLADELGENRQADEFLSGVVSRKAADEYIKQLIAKIDGDEGVLAEAEKIVAAWAEKKTSK